MILMRNFITQMCLHTCVEDWTDYYDIMKLLNFGLRPTKIRVNVRSDLEIIYIIFPET